VSSSVLLFPRSKPSWHRVLWTDLHATPLRAWPACVVVKTVVTTSRDRRGDCWTQSFVLARGSNSICSVLFFSRPRSEGWPHHRRTFSIYLCPMSFWMTLPRRVLSTSSCCPSRPCVVFLACVHLALFLALSLSPGSSFVSSWCDHSMLAFLLWRCLTVSSLLQLCSEPAHLFSLLRLRELTTKCKGIPGS